MKKEYDFFVNKRNTPHLDLYTKLIGLFYSFLGVNFGVASLYGMHIGISEYAGAFFVLSVLMFSMVSTKTTDPRREERGLFAAIADGIVFTVCTFGAVYVEKFGLLVILYLIEMICVICIIFNYFKPYKK